MPAYLTHELFGERVLQESKKQDMLQEIALYPGAYHFGLQGPDLFFYYNAVKRFNKMRKFGSLLHKEKIPQAFRFILDYSQKFLPENVERSCIRSYFYGFLCHYILDSACHPYIYYLEEVTKKNLSPRKKVTVHNEIENKIDICLFHDLTQTSVRHFPAKQVFLISEEEKDAISQFYVLLFHQVYHLTVKYEDVQKSLTNMAKVIYHTIERRGSLKSHFAKAAETILPIPKVLTANLKTDIEDRSVLNEDHTVWYNLWKKDIPLIDSFSDLFFQAVPKAASLLETFSSASEKEKEILFPDSMVPFSYGSPKLLGSDMTV